MSQKLMVAVLSVVVVLVAVAVISAVLSREPVEATPGSGAPADATRDPGSHDTQDPKSLTEIQWRSDRLRARKGESENDSTAGHKESTHKGKVGKDAEDWDETD